MFLCLNIVVIYSLCYTHSLSEPPSNVSNTSEKKLLLVRRFLLAVLCISRNHFDAHVQEDPAMGLIYWACVTTTGHIRWTF